MTTSIIIPAHNEGAVIARCLLTLLKEATPGEFEIIVVANGCSDDTALKARLAAPEATVIELASASKSAALNEGDRVARGFPRAYLDADIEITTDAMRKLLAQLSGECLFVTPTPHFVTDRLSRPARAYYKIWQLLPWIQEGGGGGVFAMSEEGRQRFQAFPSDMNDDLFTKLQFQERERRLVSGADAAVRPPTSLRQIIRIRRRSYRHSAQVRELMELDRLHHHDTKRPYGLIFRTPRLWPAAMLYVLIYAISRVLGAIGSRKRRHVWERDQSSRT